MWANCTFAPPSKGTRAGINPAPTAGRHHASCRVVCHPLANGWQGYIIFPRNGWYLYVCMHYMIHLTISSSFAKEKGLLMELRQLPPFSLERWFAEFEFVQGMRA